MYFRVVLGRDNGSIAEHQAAGPIYLQGCVFPNYRPLITGAQLSAQPVPPIAPSAQPTVPPLTLLPTPAASAPSQPINPWLLRREQPQHSGQAANQLTQDQVAAMFLPPQLTVDPVQQQPIYQTPPRHQGAQPTQQTPSRQQTIQPIHQQGLMNQSAGQSARHVLNQVVPEHLVHHMQPDYMVMPQVVPEHLVQNIQPNYQNYQGAI